jgi:hypothetical protein
MRIREEYDSIADAKKNREGHGGWYYLNHDTGRAFWYSLGHTRSQVMMDQHGSGIVGTYNEFE